MSGICGIIYLDGREASAQSLSVMVDTLTHRGPDGIGTHQLSNVAMAHLMMHVSPESIYEKQPLITASGLVLVADARIDNRSELLSILMPVRGEESTDSELILAAYEHWGNDCSDKLTGDFAFVIWNPETQSVFCSRDHIGARPFYYYHEQGKVFAFASEMKALLALEFVPNHLNEPEVAGYLAYIADFRPFTGRTIYHNIKALKPAYFLNINTNIIQETFYWNLNLGRFDHLKTDEDFVAAFQKVFTEAVNCRIRTPFEVAAHLSGGLDSTSVSCVARNTLSQANRLLHTFHMDVGLAECNEQDYAEAALAQGGFKHQYNKMSDCDFLDAITQVGHMTDRPNSFVVTPPAQLSWMRAAEHVNSRVFLTGHEGDTVVDYGFVHIENTLLKGDYPHFEELLAQFSQYAIHYNYFDSTSAWSLQEKHDFVRYNILQPVLGELKQKKQYFKIVKILFNTARGGKLLWNIVKKKIEDKKIIAAALGRNQVNSRFSTLTDAFKAKTNVEQLTKNELATHHQTMAMTDAQRTHFQKIHCFGITQFCEILEHCGVYHGFKMAHPFLDRRLLELVLVLPAHLNFNNGMLRGTLREAMRGILPEKVRTRTIKMIFNPLLLHTIQHNKRSFENTFNQFFDNNSVASQWLNRAELKKRMAICEDEKQSNELKNAVIHQIFRSLYFSIFYPTLNNNQHESIKKIPKTSSEKNRKNLETYAWHG